MLDELKLSRDQVRWRCTLERLGFESTRELVPDNRILGQEDAVDALKFGLATRTHGNNVFVRGLSGFGRISLIHQMIEESAPAAPVRPDRCYVHNFEAPDRPRLLSLTPGTGCDFKVAMDNFADFTEQELASYLSSDRVKAKQRQLNEQAQSELQKIGEPFEEELEKEGLTMVPIQAGQNVVPAILPLIDGRPVQFEELQQLRGQGKLSDEDYKGLIEKISAYEKKFTELSQQIYATQQQHQQAVQELMAEEAKSLIASRLSPVRQKFNDPGVGEFLDSIIEDLLHHRLFTLQSQRDFGRLYRVNLVRSHYKNGSTNVITEANPTITNLVGKIDREFSSNTVMARSDHLMIRPGALLNADGGYLVLDAQDILSEPGAWSVLLRTLKTGLFELVAYDPFGMWMAPQLRPDPIPVDIKVVLVGDPPTHALLDAYEPRFPNLFKVLADFSDTIERNSEGIGVYANVVARLVERDGLPDFKADAVAELVEHGARICAQKGRLTTRFGRIADIAREAAFVATESGHDYVTGADVRESIVRTKRRAELPARKYRRFVTDGSLRLHVTGSMVGQVNGLAVLASGPLSYGIPSRITASIGPGAAGAINIERESDMSGSIHTKGFLILSGLLQHLLRLDHPMAFSAAIAFEQTYGGIDGDSASGAEFCCLLSALTELPIRQELAMTGAVDQKGNVLPVGAVTEKVEGFFDTCKALGLNGSQGVLIPASNAEELMLRQDVVDAVGEGRFSVYGIDRIEQALTILTEVGAGQPTDGEYGPDTVLGIARQRAKAFWELAKQAKSSS